MNYYKNQEVRIAAKFVGVADDGKIQVKIRGVHHITVDIDPKYVFDANGGGATTAPSQSTTADAEATKPKKRKSIKTKRKQSAIEKEAEAAWGSDDDGGNVADVEEKESPIPTKPKEPVIAEEPDNTDTAEAANDDGGDDAEEKWDEDCKYKKLVVEQDGHILALPKKVKKEGSGFGTVQCAQKGKIYHWKLKIVEKEEAATITIGIIDNDHCKDNIKKNMWAADESGYGIMSNGYTMTGEKDRKNKFGDDDAFGEGDVIDVYLECGKKWKLYFSKNDGEKKEAYKVETKYRYRLGIAFDKHPTKIEFLSFAITNK